MSEAVYIHGVRDVRLGPAPSEAANDDTVIIDIAAVGLCGSDLHYYKDGSIGAARINSPFVPGHEFSATLSADCEPLGLTRGTLVAIDPADPCGQCEWCHRGDVNLCPSVKFVGAPPFDGAMRHTMRVPQKAIIPVPGTFSALDAAMLEPLGVCIHAIDLARPRLGETVTVLGCGPIGLGLIQLLRLSGVGQIVAVDPAAYRRDHGLKNGADAVVAHARDSLDFNGGRGADLVVEATNAPEGMADAIAAARIGGRVLMVGIPDGDYYTLPAAEARRRGLSIKFARRMGETFPRAIALAEAGKVDLAATVSHRLPLDKAPDAFEMQAALADSALKSVIYPNGGDS